MNLKDKIENERVELQRVENVLKLYPDLDENRDRWGTIRLSSATINPETDDVFINHNCGCCDDSPLQAWPFKIIHGERVFGKPACFIVGEKISGYMGSGEKPYDGWQDKLRAERIPEVVINKIQDFFNENKPKRYELVEDEDYD